MFLCIAAAFWVRGWLKYCHYFVSILLLDWVWRLFPMASLPSASGTLFSFVVLPLLLLKSPPSTTLEPPVSMQHSLSYPAFPAELSSFARWGCSQPHDIFQCTKIIIGALWDSYNSSFHIIPIRTATLVLFIWYCPSAHWMFKSTQKSLRAKGKSYNCGLNAFLLQWLDTVKQRGMGQTLPFSDFLVSLGNQIYSNHFKFPVPKLT